MSSRLVAGLAHLKGGNKEVKAEMKCPKCGIEFQDWVKVCTDCGTPLVEKQLIPGIPKDAIGVDVTCPTCGLRPIESATKLRWVNGFILAFQICSQTAVGCRYCIRKALLLRILRSLFTGWWSPKCLILNPIFIFYNLVNAFMPKRPNKLLVDVLDASGIRYRFLQRGGIYPK